MKSTLHEGRDASHCRYKTHNNKERSITAAAESRPRTGSPVGGVSKEDFWS